MVTLVLFIALLATAMGQSVVMTILPALGRETGLSELQVAAILSSSACIFALGSTRWSYYAARVGNRRTLIYGLSGYSLGTLCFASVFSVGLAEWLTGYALFGCLLATRVAQSTIMSATPPAAVGYVIGYVRRQNLHSVATLSRVTSANNLGQILGPGLAGLLVTYGLVAPLYAIIVLTCLALLLVWRKLPDEPPSQPVPPKITTSADVSASSPVLLLLSFAVVLFICMAMLQQSLGFMLIDYFHHSPVNAAQITGTALMISALAALSVQWTLVQRSNFTLMQLLLIAAAAMTAGYVSVATATEVQFIYIGMVGIGVGVGVGYPSVTAAATQHCSDAERAKVTGLMTASPAMGYTLGPPLGAMLYQSDIHFPLYCCVLLSACLIVINLKIQSAFSTK